MRFLLALLLMFGLLWLSWPEPSSVPFALHGGLYMEDVGVSPND